MNINQLDDEALENLYIETVDLRKKVLELVDKYGESANSLVSRTFEHNIETLYGKRKLKNWLPKTESNKGEVSHE